MLKSLLNAVVAVALLAPAMALADNWSTELPAALKQAKEEGKLVLVDFTGSDWCGPCKMLKSRVFDTPEFLEYASDKFILVEIDLPRNGKMAPDLLKRNQAVAAEFGINGFPTVLVFNAEGYTTGGFVGGRSVVAEVTQTLDVAIANAPKYNTQDLVGYEKARVLFDAHQSIKPVTNPRLMADVLALDPEDKLGIRAEKKVREEEEAHRQAVRDKLQKASKNTASLLAALDEELASDAHDPKFRRDLLSQKAGILTSTADSLEDLAAAKAIYMLSAELAGEGRESFIEYYNKMFAEPEVLLKKVQDHRASRGRK